LFLIHCLKFIFSRFFFSNLDLKRKMPAQTESLIKLLNGTSSGRGKANVKVPSFRYRRTANEANYRFRVNSVQAASTIAAGGQTIRVALPAYSAIVGEQFLKLTLNACSSGTIDQYAGAKIIKSMRLRHSDVAYEVLNVKAVWAYLVSKCRNKQDKEQRKKIFGNSAADAAEQTLIVPLLQPWSVHFGPELYGPEPVRHGRRSTLFPAYALRENAVWEIEFEPVTNFTSTGSTGCVIKDVNLCWEEVVASPDVIAAIKKKLPKAVCAPDFTFQPVTATGAEQTVDVTAVLSRAPTHSLAFYLKTSANDDPFDIVDSLSLEELECDGRILITNRDESAAERQYRDILEGRPSNRGAPEIPIMSFDNDGGYTAPGHASMQLSNTACNVVTLKLKAAASSGQIIACHERQFIIDAGTIKNMNVY
jgi:hypothetical protein